MQKVSFDFDDTLSKDAIQSYAKELIEKGYEVWIVTSRVENRDNDWAKDWNDDLFDIAEELGIPESQIKFMNMVDKYKFFIDKDFIWHLDDDSIELDLINKNTDTFGISCWGNFSMEKEM